MKLAPALTGLLVLTVLTVQTVSARNTVKSNLIITDSELVPSDNLKSSWYTSQSVTDDEMESWVVAFSSHPEFKQSEGEQFLATLLASGLQSGNAEKNLPVIKSYLAQLDLIRSYEDLPVALGILHHIGIPAVFRMDQVGETGQRSVRLTAFPSPAFVALGEFTYADYVTHMAGLDDATYPDMDRYVDAFIRIDNALQKVAQNGKWDVGQSGKFDWNRYWNKVQADPALFTTEASQSLVDFLESLQAVATPEEWACYLKWRTLETFAPALGGSWSMVHYSYRRQDQQTPARWKQVTDALDLYLTSDGICRFVPHLITSEAKNQIGYRIQLAKSEVKRTIVVDEQLSASDKERKIRDLEAMVIRVGSVTPQVNFSDFSLDQSNWMGNLIQLGAWKTQQVISGSRLPSCAETAYNPVNYQGFISRSMVQNHVKEGNFDELEKELIVIISDWVDSPSHL